MSNPKYYDFGAQISPKSPQRRHTESNALYMTVIIKQRSNSDDAKKADQVYSSKPRCNHGINSYVYNGIVNVRRELERTDYPANPRGKTHLQSLHFFRGRCFELGAENAVPETARDTESIVEIGEVMLKMILLQLLVVKREARVPLLATVQRSSKGYIYILAVVKKVMGQVIADVSENTPTVDQQCRIPIVEEDRVSELPEWSRQKNEQSRWHD